MRMMETRRLSSRQEESKNSLIVEERRTGSREIVTVIVELAGEAA